MRMTFEQNKKITKEYEYCKGLIAGLRKLVKASPTMKNVSIRIETDTWLTFKYSEDLPKHQKLIIHFILSVIGVDNHWPDVLVREMEQFARPAVVKVSNVENLVLDYYDFYCNAESYRSILGNVDYETLARLVNTINERREQDE